MIENTSTRDPIVNLIAMSGGLLGRDESAEYIGGMEAAGQAQFLDSGGQGVTEMPINGPWDELEALGFVRREAIPGDDLFTKAILPVGWKKVGTDHAMHSKIVDERGIERVSVFYKAAFYDRRADFHVVHVGYSQAREVIWGDRKPALPRIWSQMTDVERTEYVDALVRALAEEIESQEWRTNVLLEHGQERIDRIRAAIGKLPDSYRPATVD